MSELVVMEFQKGRLTEHGREYTQFEANRRGWRLNDLRRSVGLPPLLRGGDRIVPKVEGGMASFTDYLELKVLDYIFNDPNTAFVSADPFLGLWTSALTDASTGATTGEATYTGYARNVIANTSMSAAAAGSKTNSVAITFAACTSGTSTITFAGTCDSGTTGAGNMLVWFTVTSTVISTTQTPATVAIGALVVTLD